MRLDGTDGIDVQPDAQVVASPPLAEGGEGGQRATQVGGLQQGGPVGVGAQEGAGDVAAQLGGCLRGDARQADEGPCGREAQVLATPVLAGPEPVGVQAD